MAKTLQELKNEVVEKGTKAGLDVPTISKLLEWAKRHGGSMYVALIELFEIFASPEAPKASTAVADLMKSHNCCDTVLETLAVERHHLIQALAANCALDCCLRDSGEDHHH